MNLHRFAELFAGRTDRYGTDQGGSAHATPEQFPTLIKEHIYGDTPIGVYPLRDDNTVQWGCVDIDSGKPGAEYKTANEAHEAGNLIRRVLERLGLNAWLEITRSGNGAHVWTFANEPVPAPVMRNALIVAHQIVDMPYREINPKAVSVTRPDGSTTIGNYVRLPYPMARKPRCQEVLWRGVRLDNATFTNVAHGNRSPLAAYERVAGLLQEKPAPPTTTVLRWKKHHNNTRIGPLTRHILDNGPLENADRSSTLFKLALRAREDGLTANEALGLLYDADARWGKFQAANNAVQLDRMVEQVYR